MLTKLHKRRDHPQDPTPLLDATEQAQLVAEIRRNLGAVPSLAAGVSDEDVMLLVGDRLSSLTSQTFDEAISFLASYTRNEFGREQTASRLAALKYQRDPVRKAIAGKSIEEALEILDGQDQSTAEEVHSMEGTGEKNKRTRKPRTEEQKAARRKGAKGEGEGSNVAHIGQGRATRGGARADKPDGAQQPKDEAAPSGEQAAAPPRAARKARPQEFPELDGVKQPRIAEIDRATEKYLADRDSHAEITKNLAASKAELMSAMKKHKKERYHFEGQVVEYEHEETENVRVRKVKKEAEAEE